LNFVIIVLMLIGLIFGTTFLFRRLWPGEGKLRRMTQNFAIIILSILVSFILAELFFRFFAQSDSLGYTLAARNWFKSYWEKNSLGYRDIEWTPQLLKGRTKIMVLGDSFAAGWGIKEKEDLFSYQLGQRLGDRYAVMNVASAGANTKGEIEKALEYPYEPDIVILTFYVNDIDGVASEKGLPHPPALRIETPSILEPLVENSYAANFFYWRIYRLGAQEWNNRYWNWLQGRYSDAEVWAAYKELLLSISSYAEQNNKVLIVVVFPHLTAVEESLPITSRIVELYTSQGVPVLDVVDLVVDVAPQDRIVNSFDPHPSILVHQLVAEALLPLVLEAEQNFEHKNPEISSQ
jgi:hypothetical protein